MPERMPSEDEWNEWLQHPCTKRLRDWAGKSRESLRDLWEGGSLSASWKAEMIVKNAGATGACSVYKDLIDPDYQQIVIGAADDGKQDGTNPGGQGGAGEAVRT